MIRSLRSRNFRLFFFGQGVSLIGTWMQSVAMPWLVYRLTGSVVLLGVVGFAGQILTFVMAPVAGVIADRIERRRMVLVAQVLATAQALALAVLTLSGVIEVWHIVALALFGGLVRGFEIPTRQAFLVEMLEDRSDLANAIALNSFLVNGARLVGPSLAGVTIVLVGEGWCFLLNAVSFLAVIAALVAMRITPRRIEPPTTDLLGGLKEGVRYAAGSPPIRSVLLLLCLVSLMGVPYVVLMPVFAKDILHGDAYTMGFMLAAGGVGAVAGAIFLASRRSTARIGRTIAIAAAVFGTSLVAFSFSRSLWLSLPILVCTGAAMMLQMASSNTLLQTITEEDKRGRIMSFYTMAFMGMGPFGSLLAGNLAAWIGATYTVLAGGAATLVGAAALARVLGRIDGRPAAMEIGPADAVV
ncbi:MAG: MFS transporter [Planctomycetota bacterium]|nr:MFS transporter [Planctomycetota bacterium]